MVDPAFGERLFPLAQRIHTWAVGTPTNEGIAEQFWAGRPKPIAHEIERGITTFIYKPDRDPESWRAPIIRSLDDHHNRYAHTPGYTVLEVYGARPSVDVQKAFEECGFLEFEVTDFGFIARKHEP